MRTDVTRRDGPALAPPKLPPVWFRHLFWRAHRVVYRASGGRGLWGPDGKRGWGALHLTTTGRRSGRPRSVIVGYIEDDAKPVLVPMNGGEEGAPAWWLNLQAHPDAVIRTKGGPERRVRARKADGAERDRLWKRWTDLGDGLDAVAASRSTETPVVVLEPTEEG